MRFCLKMGIGLICMLFQTQIVVADTSCKDRITVAVPNMPPYSQLENDGSIMGLDVRFIKQIAKLSGCDIKFRTMPWKRGLLSLKEQQVQMVIMASFRQERTVFGRYSRPYRWETQLISARTSLPNLPQLESLEDLHGNGIVIGGIRGAFHGPEFEALYNKGPANSLKRDITDYGKAITLMRFGRLDGIVSDSGVFRYLAEKNKYRDWVFLPFPVYQNKVHLLLAKNVSDQAMDRINQAIEDIISGPTYLDIYPRESRLTIQESQS